MKERKILFFFVVIVGFVELVVCGLNVLGCWKRIGLYYIINEVNR